MRMTALPAVMDASSSPHSARAGDVAVDRVLEFVNTRYDGKGGHIERFDTAEDFAAWAREHDLLDEAPISESEVMAARELRQALLVLLLAHADHPSVAAADISAAERHLTHAGELYPVRVVLSATGVATTGQSRGATGVLGSVLAAASQVAQQGQWPRLKACCSAPCQHAFFDRTKNGSQRYCQQKCSTRAAMRAHRERSN